MELARRLGVDPDVINAHLEAIGESPTDDLAGSVDSATASEVTDRVISTPAMRSAGEAVAQTPEPPIRDDQARVVPVHGLGSPGAAERILDSCRRASQQGETQLVLDFSDADGFFPNAVVPTVAVVDHYRRSGLNVVLENLPPAASAMRLDQPIPVTASNLRSEPTMARVWRYETHKEANDLTTAIVESIRYRVECTEGVTEALEWCLYEVLDNVTQHSSAPAGFVMVQHHSTSKMLAVCVADTGIGIQRSLSRSVAHKPRTAFDALTLAIKEGVTRDPSTNQGNGLFGLFQIVDQNKGRLNIRSGRGSMRIDGNRVSGDSDRAVIGADNHGTIVDFQLAAKNPVSLAKALNYDHQNLFLESLETADGEHAIEIRQQAGGAGSRAAARELRTFVVNILNEGAPFVVLDFAGQAVVSSSFADEVIGKLVLEMGFIAFSNRVRLRNMSPTVANLLDRAIALRVGAR